MCCKSFLPKETVSRDFGPLFLKKKNSNWAPYEKAKLFNEIFSFREDIREKRWCINDQRWTAIWKVKFNRLKSWLSRKVTHVVHNHGTNGTNRTNGTTVLYDRWTDGICLAGNEAPESCPLLWCCGCCCWPLRYAAAGQPTAQCPAAGQTHGQAPAAWLTG